MILGLLAGIQPEDEAQIDQDLTRLNRKLSEMDQDAIEEHLFLYSNIGQASSGTVLDTEEFNSASMASQDELKLSLPDTGNSIT